MIRVLGKTTTRILVCGKPRFNHGNRKSRIRDIKFPVFASVAASIIAAVTEEQEEHLDISKFMDRPINDVCKLETSSEMRHKMEVMSLELQAKLCREIERIEGTTKFHVNRWIKCGLAAKATCEDPDRPSGAAKVWEAATWPYTMKNVHGHAGFFEGAEAGGISCLMEDGAVFEKVVINQSIISGQLKPPGIYQLNKTMGFNLPDDEEVIFHAAGIHAVLHSRNPHVPAMRCSFRYFEVNPEIAKKEWWFSGLATLNPVYFDQEDVKHWHCTIKSACDMYSPTYYKRFKKWCDEYFYIPHRCLRVGMGGIFFDDFKSTGKDNAFNYVQAMSDTVMEAYIPLVQKHKNDSFGPRERNWQLIRRGYETEFDLKCNRGMNFVFNTPGVRTESILAALPPRCVWKFDHYPDPNSKEQAFLDILSRKNPINWVKEYPCPVQA